LQDIITNIGFNAKDFDYALNWKREKSSAGFDETADRYGFCKRMV
jgi:hypothetical protein